MTKSISVAEAKSRFSEFVHRASAGKERFRIERRGKPVGAIVSAEDLERLEESAPPAPNHGLLAAVGSLAEFSEFDAIMDEVVQQRATAMDREVSLE